MTEPVDRRQAVKSIVIAIGGVATTLILPARWTRPIVESVVVPANAQQLSPASSFSQQQENSLFQTPFLQSLFQSQQQSQASDIRLKKNIKFLEKLPSGIDLYSFQYIDGSATTFVGVLAQEIRKIRPDAVIERSSGYLAVDYAKLGLKMMTLSEYRHLRGVSLAA
ncbi:MAG TPA: tail fiber domain-containing protein [Candidatus Binataceae bacterium]|nr:tail fiber domain-containing protein [Candidatus Binataceae bacterium]